MRAGFEKVDVLNVEVMDSNSSGEARDEKLWQTRRKLARSSDFRCSSRLSRHWSFSQKREKTELVERIRLHIELFAHVACDCQYDWEARCARYVLHRPSMVVAAVDAISPNSNLDLACDTFVAALV